ncbi:MAG: hypothetical protein RR449_01500 [Christensenella sp.]
MDVVINNRNRILCIVLCLLICISIILIPQSQAHAVAIVDDIGIAAFATFILAAAGLTAVVSTSAADGTIYQVGNDFASYLNAQNTFSLPTLTDIWNDYKTSTTPLSFQIPADMYSLAQKYIADTYPNLVNGNNYTITYPTLDFLTYPVPVGQTSVSFHFSQSVATSTSLFAPTYLSFNYGDSFNISAKNGDVSSNYLKEIIYPGFSYTFVSFMSKDISTGLESELRKVPGNNSMSVVSNNGKPVADVNDIKSFICRFLVNGVTYLVPVWGLSSQCVNVDIYNMVSSKYAQGDVVFCGSRTNVITADSDAISIGGSDVLGGDEAWKKKEDQTAPFPFPVTGTGIGDDVITVGVPKSAAGTQDIVIDGISIPNISDITYTDVVPNVGTGEGETDVPTTPPNVGDMEVPATFLGKFPFCIPFDIARSFQMLVAPPTVPKWEIPFNIDSMGAHEKVVIDFSNFSVVASISRWFLCALFILLLIIGTRKLIKG